MIVDPYGKVLKSASATEETIFDELGKPNILSEFYIFLQLIILFLLDLAVVDKVRLNIPVFHQRRDTLYDTIEKK